MAGDIANRDDLTVLLQNFYAVATKDECIGHFFDELDLTAHLPVIVDFWDKLLFGRPVYFGNPLAVHQVINRQNPILPEHFARWVALFGQTTDALFAGPQASQAKHHAANIAHNLATRLTASLLPAGFHAISRTDVEPLT